MNSINTLACKQYFTDVLDGKIIACDKMKIRAEQNLQDLEFPNEFHFDINIANKHTGFIEKFCKIPAGRLGAPFILEPFQKAHLEIIFGMVDDNNLRRYKEVFWPIARKNGKTSLCAAIEQDLLCNDNEGAPEIYNIATKREQAQKGFNACVNMRQLSPMLRKHTKKRQSDIYYPDNLGFIKALSSNTSTLDGLDVHGGILDEVAAMKNRDLYDLIKQGTTARMQPLIFEISSFNFIRENVFDSLYDYATNVLTGKIIDPRFYACIYELDSVEDAFNPDMLIKANPGIGTIKSKEFLLENMQRAIDDPSFKPTYLVKDCNIKQTNEAAWLTFEQLNNEKICDLSKFKYCCGGFDAADSVDLNSAKAICMRPNDDKIYTKSMYWIPEEVIERQRASRRERDNVPYELWVSQGLMRTCPGNKVDKRVFLEWFKELRETDKLYTLYIGYDPWHISDDLLREFKQEFGENSMIPIRQGAQTLSNPMKDFAADLEAKRIVYNNNPIDKWCLINTSIKRDINDNIQPIKGNDKRNRIDGTISWLCAYIAMHKNMSDYLDYNNGVEL